MVRRWIPFSILFSSSISFSFFLFVLFILLLVSFAHSFSLKQSFWILLKMFWIQNHCDFSFHLLSLIHSLASHFIHFKGTKKRKLNSKLKFSVVMVFLFALHYPRFDKAMKINSWWWLVLKFNRFLPKFLLANVVNCFEKLLFSVVTNNKTIWSAWNHFKK